MTNQLFIVLISLLYAFLFGTVSAALDLQLGGLSINDQGLKLVKAGQPKENNLGFTVVPTLKAIMDVTDLPVPVSASKPTKKSYEDEVYDQLAKFKPSYSEAVARRHRAQYAHVTGEEEMADANCPDGDKACENELLMWAAAPPDPKLDAAKAEKKLKKAKRDKKYEWALKMGNSKGAEELKKAGGPDPYAGVLPHDILKAENDLGSEEAKKAKLETKGTKTLKGSRKAEKKGGKEEKKVTLKPTHEPNVATAPDL